MGQLQQFMKTVFIMMAQQLLFHFRAENFHVVVMQYEVANYLDVLFDRSIVRPVSSISFPHVLEQTCQIA